MTGPCKAPGCQSCARAKGLCYMHYQRLRQKGCLEPPVRVQKGRAVTAREERERNSKSNYDDNKFIIDLLSSPDGTQRAEPSCNRARFNLGDGATWHRSLPHQP